MKNIRKNIIFFILFLCCVCLSSVTFSYEDYIDKDGKTISFKIVSPKRGEAASAQTSQDKERLKNLFVDTFFENYKDVSPEKIKPHFTEPKNVREWLQTTFDEEWDYFNNASQPINFIHVYKENVLIGFSIVEEWNNKMGILHVRQMAIAPQEQRRGYGIALIEGIKKQLGMQTRGVIADTRKINERARQFYKKVGFKEVEPHDLELRSTGNYIGLEWLNSDVYKEEP